MKTLVLICSTFCLKSNKVQLGLKKEIKFYSILIQPYRHKTTNY